MNPLSPHSLLPFGVQSLFSSVCPCIPVISLPLVSENAWYLIFTTRFQKCFSQSFSLLLIISRKQICSLFLDVEMCTHICTYANIGCVCTQMSGWKLLFDVYVCIVASPQQNIYKNASMWNTECRVEMRYFQLNFY